MPYHVEIGSPFNFARALNVDEASLRAAVLEPWVAGLPLTLGERSWEPSESRLTILEGPELPPSPGGGENWGAALRTAEDVTRPLLEAADAGASAQTATIVEADSMEEALGQLRDGRLPQQVSWVSAVERLENRDPEIAAAILVVKRSDARRPRL